MALPSGYTELEYIRSDESRSAWIDTEFSPTDSTQIILECHIEKAVSGATYVFGLAQYEPDKNFQLRIISSAQYLTYDYGNSSKNFPIIPPGDYIVNCNKNICTIGTNSVINSENQFQCDSNLLLLASTTTSGARLGSPGTIYRCEIYNDGTKMRDYIPCTSPSGEIGVYDIVNGQFYGNAGSGAFIAGPEVISHPEKPSYVRNEMCVSLRWGSVDCEGYNLYKNGGLLTSTKYNYYVDYDVVDGEDITYSIKAYNSSYESDPIEITVSVREGYTVLLPVVNSAFFQ